MGNWNDAVFCAQVLVTALAGVQRPDGSTQGGVRAGVVPRGSLHRRLTFVQARGRQRRRRLPTTRALRRRGCVRLPMAQAGKFSTIFYFRMGN